MKTIYLLLLFYVLNSFSSIGQDAITLIQPYDKDTIETVYPMFSWHYMDLSGPRTDVKYSFILVELTKEQSASAGLVVNTPLIHIDGIAGFHFSYPFDAPPLEYNNRYGWKIQKKINGVVVSESEAWEFILYKEIIVPKKYVVLNTDFTSFIYDVNREGLYFKLKSRYKSNGTLNYKVLNDNSEIMRSELGDDEKLGQDDELEKTGQDFYFLKTDIYPEGTYTLIVKDQKGNTYNTRFRIK